jgi:glycosyltransferase involved in cell wall biosynthesis
MTPKISVLFAVYNNQSFLAEAIESILAQTYADFEFLIVNDGSTDRSTEIITSYADKDSRIRVINNGNNIGLTTSLNKALACVNGEYIARMDGDDVSLPERLERQAAFLETHPDIWAVGGQIEFIDGQGLRSPAHAYEVDEKLLRWNAILNGPTVIHPAVMIRREKLELVGNYPEDCRLAQDAALWRMFYMLADFPLTNLPDVVLYYRQHPGSAGSIFRVDQVETVVKYQSLFYSKILGEQCPPELVSILNFSSRSRSSAAEAADSIQLLLRLFKCFCRRYSLNKNQLRVMRRMMGQRISGIAYRFPIRCISQVMYSIYLYPGVAREYLQIYNQYLRRKLKNAGHQQVSGL